jgi:hypothetical protein
MLTAAVLAKLFQLSLAELKAVTKVVVQGSVALVSSRMIKPPQRNAVLNQKVHIPCPSATSFADRSFHMTAW